MAAGCHRDGNSGGSGGCCGAFSQYYIHIISAREWLSYVGDSIPVEVSDR
jgi:hypothetical protein